MVTRVLERKTVDIPSNVKVQIKGRTVEVEGEKGKLVRDFSFAPVSIKLDNDKIKVEALWPRKKEAALVGTISSHIKNMIIGVTEGFTYKLKIVYSHFPISVKIAGDKILIENFVGEKSPRVAKIVGDVKVRVEGEDIIVQGINVEDVGQTAANIELATKVKRKDPRVFLDGIYIYEKKRGMTD
ncbi:50S ribosomal protein L6 [Candidatus Bathyarchaeota archaeon]|nr:MAG: 50S ribosomal protein L6 [Candidatus Bathyarchaeota archaeon]